MSPCTDNTRTLFSPDSVRQPLEPFTKRLNDLPFSLKRQLDKSNYFTQMGQ